MQETLVGFLDREDLLEKGQATHFSIWGFPGGSDGKESACSAGDLGSITGLGRSPGEYMATHSSILAWRIPMDRGAWRATVRRVAKSRTQLSIAQQH